MTAVLRRNISVFSRPERPIVLLQLHAVGLAIGMKLSFETVVWLPETDQNM